jgi:uncharacterized protein (TIGR02611 family)
MTEDPDEDRGRIGRRWARTRDRLRDWPAADFAYRMVVGVVGLALLAVGLIAIPYPGPGWAIVFLGLAVLASEFRVWRRLLNFVRRRYDAAMGWFRRRHMAVQGIATAFAVAVMVASLWMLGVIGWTANLVGWAWAWLTSPIGLGAK